MEAEIRCCKCGKKFGENFWGHYEVVCPRCKTYNVFNVDKVGENDLTFSSRRASFTSSRP